MRDFLVGQRYARIAAQRIRIMQRTVVAQLLKGLSDPLAEAETWAQPDDFLSEQGVPEEEWSRCGKLLERGVQTAVPRAPEELIRPDEEPQVSKAPTPDEVPAHVGPEHKGRLGEALVYDVHRMSVLGKSPKEARAKIPASLEPGFYISCSSPASATSFLASTTWTTLSRATLCPRELSTTVSVDTAHVMVCVRVRGRTRPRCRCL